MKDIATRYKAIGISCLPCKLDKSPDVTDTWNRPFKLTEFENAKAIGLMCGKISGGLECIDIDNHQKTAKENLKLLIDEIKPLYDKYKFPIEQTQGGGYHLIYKCDYIEGNQKLASVPIMGKNKKWIGDAIFETRGEGGYFVAYPSPGYIVIKNDIFTIPTITKDERNEIISVCKSYNTFITVVNSEFEQKDKPGDLYNNTSESISDMRSILASHGWKEIEKNRWTRPNKSKGISATLGSAAPNIFYVFSANAYPFEPNKGYTPFQVMGLLEYNGDFKECAKRLSEKLGLNKSKEYKKSESIEKTQDEKKILLQKSLIDLDIPIEKPPVILYISDFSGTSTVHKRVLTLGNFSAITGKAKSRKTYLLTMLSGALIKNGNLYNKFYATLPENKRQVLYFDTEQGLYDSANTIKRIERLASVKADYFGAFNIREYSPLERCELIEYALSICKNVGFIAIDGVADLAKAINDEEEATRVTGLFLKWTKVYDCHVCTIIHQNKNDNFATGHLGSSIIKKAEIVISVSKEKGSLSHSNVSCDYSRGIDFDDFGFYINDNGLPELSEKVFHNTPDRYID